MIRQHTPGAGASPPSRLSTEAENTVDSGPRLGATLSTGQQAAPRIISASPGRKSFENQILTITMQHSSRWALQRSAERVFGAALPSVQGRAHPLLPPPKDALLDSFLPQAALNLPAGLPSPFICWTYLFWNLLYLLIGYILLFWRRD